MAILAAFALTMAVLSGLIARLIDDALIMQGAQTTALVGIGFAILALRDDA